MHAHGAAAAAYMLDAQREDGLFAYELDVSDAPAPRNPKNWMDGEPYGSVVRQAGAALFLADYRPTAGDLEPQVRAATRKALDALAQRALTFENGTLLTLGEKREHNARAGATALALAATLELSQVEAGLEDMRKGYLRALVALRTELVKNRAADGNKPGPGEQSWYAGFAQSPDELRASAPCYNGEAWLRRRMNNELNFPPNFERLVLSCIDAKFCKKIFVGKFLRRSTRFTCCCTAQTSIFYFLVAKFRQTVSHFSAIFFCKISSFSLNFAQILMTISRNFPKYL